MAVFLPGQVYGSLQTPAIAADPFINARSGLHLHSHLRKPCLLAEDTGNLCLFEDEGGGAHISSSITPRAKPQDTLHYMLLTSQSQPEPFLHASGWITVAPFETEHRMVTREPVRVFMRGATPDYSDKDKVPVFGVRESKGQDAMNAEDESKSGFPHFISVWPTKCKWMPAGQRENAPQDIFAR
ncbi:unnamed protein product [Pleuronectes platessa]|uniref:Uncharacterized protein n=1 Tax=Pleuronectes platessa TaxID=8262 RepID=A0A9N7YVC5_PLEPL|nr:unnamed protein product [Pleuronectes platessa]